MEITEFKGRREDQRLLTGQGRFTADWNFPGQLHAHFLRSDRAHAQIVSLDKSAALKSPGVVAIFTGEDTAHFKTPPPQLKAPGRGGAAMKVPERPILARGRVRYVGQEIALVVAESAAAAQDAAEKIEIEFRELPAVTDAATALQAGAPLLHEDIPGNLALDFEYGNEQAAAEAFGRAVHVTRLTLDSTRVCGAPIEPKACAAVYDKATDSYDLYSPTQGKAIMLPVYEAITGVPAERIRIHAHDVGGGFGVRSAVYMEYCALMAAAKALGKPVRWVGSRFDSIVSDFHGRAMQLSGELALDAQGRFLGLRVRWICNMGAYLSQSGPLISTVNPATHAINAYAIPVVYGRHLLALTNTTTTSAYRGAGRPGVSYLVERLVDEAARQTGIDPIELRRRNVIRKEDYPYKTPTGSTYDSGDFPGQLDAAARYAGWDAFPQRRAEARKRGKLRGIGCAAFCEPSGSGATPRQEAAIHFDAAGNAILHVLSGPSGQGHETVYADIVAEVFGLPAEKIIVKPSDPDGPALMGGGTVGSRSTITHGSALFVTAHAVIKKGLDFAAKDLEVSPGDVEFSKGGYRVQGTDMSISFEEVARRHTSQLDTVDSVPMPTAFPGGVHIAEVEIDPDTGAVEVINYIAVDDCGRALNHTLLEGQLHGGILQGIGQALVEHCVYDDSGQLLTGSFMDYAMPRAEMLCSVQLYDHSVPSPTNPLGVKGVGEAGTVGALPTIGNAVIDALRPLGIHELGFPFSPARVWEAIATATGG